MTNIRAAIAAAMLVFGGAAVASAQQPTQPPRAHAARKIDHALMKGVALTDAEKANVKAVRQKYAAQRKALQTADKPQRAALRRAEQNDLRAALGTENRAKFDANAAAMRKRFGKRNGAAKP